MRRRRIVQLTVVVVAIVVAIILLGGHLPGCAPSPTADITFTMALDTAQKVGVAYNIRYLPTTVLIDEEGIVRSIRVGPFGSKEDLISWLEEITSRESTPPHAGVAPSVGHVAPDFILPTLEGEAVELSQLRGKWVLINFWATWCPACVAQQPHLQAAFVETGEKVEFIGINLGESEQKVREHIRG
ncbi:MAG: redoxin domain-containing protein [Dehalococcoidia bacterium]